MILEWVCAVGALLSLAVYFIAGSIGAPDKKFYIGACLFTITGFLLYATNGLYQ